MRKFALGLGGRDGRVGNEGQVVTEHGAAEDDARTVGDTESGALREGDGDRDEDRDRADTGAHGHGDEGRDDEHAGDRHASGQELEQEVRGAGRAAGCLRDAAEHAGEQEDEDHDGDVVIADALRAEVDLLIEGPFAVLRHGGDPRDGEREDDRHDVETHLPVDGVDVLKENADTEVQHEEDQDGQERLAVGLRFVGCVRFHKTPPKL